MTLHGLNEHQHSAVTTPLGHLLVLAGAGSGKTRVLVSRIAWLIEHEQQSPNSILAVTFTNKAAGELKSRLSNLLHTPIQGLWVGTFHGLCHRLLRRHYQEANLPESFHILDSDDQARILKRVILALNLDPEQWTVKQAQAFINSKKEEGLRAKHITPDPYGPTKTLLTIYQGYEKACQIAGVIDFAELLLRTHELLRDNPELLAHYQSRFKNILVDEFQDTNTIQYAWIRLLSGQSSSVMVVGDDDQSIYGWRGAKVENIQRFSSDFKPCKVIRLEQNYRSTATILNAANALITNNDGRMGKNLWTDGPMGEKIQIFNAFNELEEARFVADSIQKALVNGTKLNDIAILYRSNAQSRVLEEALLRSGTAYRIHGGLRFFERAEIKDTLAYVRLIANFNDDNAFERVVNLPTRGIGDKTLQALRELTLNGAGSLFAASRIFCADQTAPLRARTALAGFLQLIERLQHDVFEQDLDEQFRLILELSGLHAYFAGLKGDLAQSKLDNLEELVSAAKEFRYDQDAEEPLPLLVAFLAHASLESGEMQAAEHEAYVHLMTLHAAKGLEFPLVFLVGMEESLFPSSRSIQNPANLEEERRLCYVGMTRAMQQLIMTYAEVRRQYGREEYHRPSRFLNELPSELLYYVRPRAKTTTTTNFHIATSTTHESGFSLGQQVRHPQFGSGIILALDGQGAQARAHVQFNSSGSKWLVLTYARLESEE